MKFLIDNNLPPLLAEWLIAGGHDAVAARDLPNGPRTGDSPLAAVADVAGRVVVPKGRDLLDLHLADGSPKKLLRVTTGNIKNRELLGLFESHFAAALAVLHAADLAVLSEDGIGTV